MGFKGVMKHYEGIVVLLNNGKKLVLLPEEDMEYVADTINIEDYLVINRKYFNEISKLATDYHPGKPYVNCGTVKNLPEDQYNEVMKMILE